MSLNLISFGINYTSFTMICNIIISFMTYISIEFISIVEYKR